MGKKEYANEPLMYIQQPGIGTPRARMQHHYMSPKKTQKNDELIQQEGKEHAKRNLSHALKPNKSKKRGFGQGLNAQRLQHQHNEVEKAPKNHMNNNQKNNKTFKDMTLREKIEHLARDTSYIPKIRCEIKIKDQTFRGTIHQFKDEYVLMQPNKRKQKVSIPFSEIEQVRMLGL